MKAYLAYNTNLEVRFACAAGGVFPAMARKAFQQGYAVAGAVWNEDYTVSHILSTNKKDLERLRGVKPIDSKASIIFGDIESYLEAGGKVLFAGTPAQVASLLSTIKGGSPNLLTVAVGSGTTLDQEQWKKYLSDVIEARQARIKNIHFANKEISGRRFSIKLVFENGEVVYDDSLGGKEQPMVPEIEKSQDGILADIELKAAGIDYTTPDGKLGATLIQCKTEKGESFFDDAIKKKINCHSVDNSDLCIDDDMFHFNTRSANRNQSSLRNILEYVVRAIKYSRWNVASLYKNFYFNLWSRQVETSIRKGHYLLFCPHCIVDLSPSSKIKVGGLVYFGRSVYRGDCGITKLLLQPGAILDIRGNYSFGVGSDIQVLRGGEFIIEGCGDTNMNVEIVCGEKIEFKEHVYLGRNVCIRDTNGNHYLNRQGYHTSRPVVLGAHTWICDRAVVMPGVHIGAGGIVGANSFVVTNVPSYTMVSGNPAKVVDEDINWKE